MTGTTRITGVAGILALFLLLPGFAAAQPAEGEGEGEGEGSEAATESEEVPPGYRVIQASPVIEAPPENRSMVPPSAHRLDEDQEDLFDPVPPQPAPTDPATGEPTGEAPVVAPATPKIPFIKGDLIYPGTRRLLSRFDHIGVSVGPHIVGNDFFVGVSPGLAFYLSNGLAFSANIPLKLLAVEGNSLQSLNPEFGGLKIRKEDWDERADWAKIIRFLTYGRKEANVYITVNTMRPSTLGHGLLLKRYQGDIDVDRSLTGFIFDAYNRYAGFQFQLNDITLQNQLIGGIGFVKPFSLFSDNVMARSLSLGFEYVADLEAPRCVRIDAESDACVQGSGHMAGADPFTGDLRDHTFVRTDPETGRFAVNSTTVHAAGLSAEVKLYKDERNVDLKLYTTYHSFLNDGGGSGLASGVLARLNAGTEWISAFRLRGEYRNFGDGYLPSYFDTLYEIQKYGYLYESLDYQVTPTKYQQVFGDPENGFNRIDRGTRHGFNLEGHWALFKRHRSAKKLGFGFGISDSTGPNDSNFYAHIEFPGLGIMQLFASYMRNNVADIGGLFGADMFTAGDTVLLSGLRLQLLPVLFINAHYSRSYRTVASPGSEYHLANANVVDDTGTPEPQYGLQNLFENVQTLYVELEFGWEFDDE